MPSYHYTTIPETNLQHTIHIKFLCPQCGQDSGYIPYVVNVPYKKTFSSDVGLLTDADQNALSLIRKNKVLLEVMRMWISSERGEYKWVKAHKQDILCPHCSTKQSWQPKKQLFKKAEPIDPRFFPQIDWRWQEISPEAVTWPEQVRRRHPELFDKKQNGKPPDTNRLLFLGGDVATTKNIPSEISDLEMWPSMSSWLVDVSSAWAFVVPGLAGDLTRDLMANHNPIDAVYTAFLIKDKPDMNQNEIAYQFFFENEKGKYKAWAIITKGRVVRTEVQPMS
jgi:hypothetical protein